MGEPAGADVSVLAADVRLAEEHTSKALTTDCHQEERQRGILLNSWVEAVAHTSFVPGGRAKARALLEESLRQLAMALVAEPFDAAAGYRVGFEIVAAQITSPRALGNTIALLSQQFIVRLGISHPQAPARLAALLGQLAAGFTEAMRNVVVASSEAINRAERVAWREQQTELSRRLQQTLLSERSTGLPNRARLAGRLDELLTNPPRGARLGICLINLDRFKAVNDSLGRDKGDRLLRAVALRLRDLVKQDGRFLAHLGADEFAILVEGTTGVEEMAKVADRALSAIREPFSLEGHSIPVTASAGIVECAAAGAHPAELLRTADVVLGWAKADHRDHWAVYDPDRYDGELHRHELTAAMPSALSDGDFTLAYQPLIRLADRSIVGVEALARWQHPTHGAISPAQFIPLAESTGLIVPLGLHLLERACRQAASWRRRRSRPFMISVNLAAPQLRSPGLAAATAQILHRTGLPADQLQFEITESTIVNTEDTATLETLDDLAGTGVRLAIDDFGTGYSCLAYLADLPVHAIKLAGRFLRGIGEASTEPILPAMIDLGHDLGLAVTAEGVENPAQARYLTSLGCDFGQGFHFGPPTTAEHITRLLAAS